MDGCINYHDCPLPQLTRVLHEAAGPAVLLALPHSANLQPCALRLAVGAGPERVVRRKELVLAAAATAPALLKGARHAEEPLPPAFQALTLDSDA
jgi:hypothetical protein